MDRRTALQDASPQPDLWAHPARVVAPKPHDTGHRERLRQRAAVGGLAALPDYEVLELLLFRSIPRGDVKPLAKRLIARFGALGAVLGAGPEALKTVAGVGDAVALDLALVQAAGLRAARELVAKRPVIASWSALLAYVKAALAHEAREQVRILFLDKKNQLIADETVGHGTVDHAPVYPRELMRRALELSASALIVVHKANSRNPTPNPSCALARLHWVDTESEWRHKLKLDRFQERDFRAPNADRLRSHARGDLGLRGLKPRGALGANA